MNVALAALDAVITVSAPRGERTIPIGQFHRLPGDAPQADTVLLPGEMITAIDLPASPFARHASYLKVRDRASYAFALVSAGTLLDIDNGVVRDARIALGGVAHRPWRVPAAEAALVGSALSDATAKRAAALLTAGAVGLKDNQFKIAMVQRVIVRALRQAEGTV